MILCDYDCGMEAKFKFKNGKNCCSKSVNSCEGFKRAGNVNKFGRYLEDFEVFIKDSKYPRHKLKERIIKKKLIEYQCAICGIDNIWQGKEMPLILDHINGVNNDNRLFNLRFVCSNCDSQLDTYKSKNIKK